MKGFIKSSKFDSSFAHPSLDKKEIQFYEMEF